MKKLLKKIGLLIVAVILVLPVYAYDFEVDSVYYNITSSKELTCELAYFNKFHELEPPYYTKVSHTESFNVPAEVSYNGHKLTVTSIGKEAFRSIDNLRFVEFPNTVSSIGKWAFSGCKDLTYVKLPDSLKSIGAAAFQLSGLTSIEIPSSVTTIGGASFAYCYSLEYLEINDTLTRSEYASSSIEYSAFAFCKKLKSVKFGNSLKSISEGTFQYCDSLVSISLPGSVEEITLYDKDDWVISEHVFGQHILKQLELEYGEKVLYTKYYSHGSKNTCGWGDDMVGAVEELFIDRRLNSVMVTPSLKKLTIGEHLTDCAVNFSQSKDLDTIICYAQIPPKIIEASNKQYLDVIVKVPEQSLSLYQQADGWKNFWNLEGDPSLNSNTSGVENIILENPEKVETGRYDLNGRPVSEFYKGITIIHYSDGSTRKIVNK